MSAPAGLDLDEPRNVDRAVTYLKTVTPSVEGEGGDARAVRVAMVVRDLGVSEDRALELMLEHWNPRCAPPWDVDDLRVKVANAYRYAQNEAGARALRSPTEVFAGAAGIIAETIAEQRATCDGAHAGAEPPAYPRPLSAAELAGGHFPRADYAIKDFILKGRVNLLYGDGGTGKTLLAEHMAVAVAAGRDFLGHPTMQMPVLMVLAEDDHGETKSRLEAICDQAGVCLAHLPIRIWCLVGSDISIAHILDDGRVEHGPFYEPLCAELESIGQPCFLVLDTVSDIVNLDENKRLPVNAFCKRVLGGLCERYGTTPLALAHPSKSAMLNGFPTAGSTAWRNSVRNLLTLDRPKDDDAKRVLAVAKANYGAEAKLEIYQVGGAFMRMADVGRSEADVRGFVLAATLHLIDEGNDVVRSTGNGLKPADVAREVRDQHGVSLTGKEVLRHLNDLVRTGRLAYRPGGHAARGQKAGFCRREALK